MKRILLLSLAHAATVAGWGHLPSGRPARVLRASSDDGDASTSSESLYQAPPAKKPFTFGILTSGFPPQQLLVPFVKFVTFNVWCVERWHPIQLIATNVNVDFAHMRIFDATTSYYFTFSPGAS